jgi:hypothetical protein
MAAVRPNVAAVGPLPAQGDKEANPSPAPRESRMRLTATATNAPPIMADQDKVETPLSVKATSAYGLDLFPMALLLMPNQS